MSKQLVFFKDHFDPQKGLIPLKRGDDWVLTAQILDKYSGVTEPVDLSDTSATGYFSAADGSVIEVLADYEDATVGSISFTVSQAETELMQTSEEGIGVYVIADLTEGLTTIESAPVLEIKDRAIPT